MGGYGSGRRHGRPLAEDCLVIDLAWMLRTGRLVPGRSGQGQLHWKRGGEPCGQIRYSYAMTDPDRASLTLRFSVTRRADGSTRDYVQHVPLSYTLPPFGGRRWWMLCPLTGARVGKLYVPGHGDLFASRKAWGIAYQSQRSDRAQRPFDALFRLQRRLGCAEGWGGFVTRPKGMWWRTYDRHFESFLSLEARCDAVMDGHNAKMRAALGGNWP